MIILYGRIFKLAREMSRSGHTQMTPSVPRKSTGVPEATFNDSKLGPVTDNQTQDTSHFRDNNTIEYLHSDNEHIKTNESSNGVKHDANRNICCELREKDGRLNSSSSRKPLTESVCTKNDMTDEMQRRRSRGNSDTKVIKTLGVIMGCFCLCWLPFFMMQLLLALLSAAGYDTANMIPVSVFRFLQWLGYVNSFLNPLIYAKFDREFRGPFKMILLCHCRNINARLRAVHYSAQYGLPSASNKHQSSITSSMNARDDLRSRWFKQTS
ncbi:unnamed protein product [Heterobilharzia americana]|nr:unnamed protein product [Heterobilharzia americana]